MVKYKWATKQTSAQSFKNFNSYNKLQNIFNICISHKTCTIPYSNLHNPFNICFIYKNLHNFFKLSISSICIKYQHLHNLPNTCIRYNNFQRFLQNPVNCIFPVVYTISVLQLLDMAASNLIRLLQYAGETGIIVTN